MPATGARARQFQGRRDAGESRLSIGGGVFRRRGAGFGLYGSLAQTCRGDARQERGRYRIRRVPAPSQRRTPDLQRGCDGGGTRPELRRRSRNSGGARQRSHGRRCAAAEGGAQRAAAAAGARGGHVVRGVFQGGPRGSTAADHVSVQWRTGFVDRVAAHGRLRTQACFDTGRYARPGRTLSPGRQRVHAARCERPGVRRRARYRFRPSSWCRQGEGVLRRRSGRACLRQFHR